MKSYYYWPPLAPALIFKHISFWIFYLIMTMTLLMILLPRQRGLAVQAATSRRTARKSCAVVLGFVGPQQQQHQNRLGLVVGGRRQEQYSITWQRPFYLRNIPPLVVSAAAAAKARPEFSWRRTTKQRFFSSMATCSDMDIEEEEDDDDQDDSVSCPVNENDKHELFRVTAPFPPSGDQPEAIAQLKKQMIGQQRPDKFSTLCGITGTGKTLVMAHLIQARQCPTLVLCHNKTLAAQVARELRSFLSGTAVELFVSYYNHYTPESFSETTNKYIAKKSSINHDIDALRHGATRALLTRRDVVVVASVSCMYGLGLPAEYLQASVEWNVGERVVVTEDSSQKDIMDNDENDESDENDEVDDGDLLGPLHRMLYQKSNSDEDFERGTYQHSVSMNDATKQEVHTIVLWPPHEKFPMQITAVAEHDEHVESSSASSSSNKTDYRITSIQQGTADGFVPQSSFRIFPARHHVTSEDRLEQACLKIEEELAERLKELQAENKLVEAQRLQQRVVNDVYMLRETGFCQGMENYSRHLAGRAAGQPPETLLDYMSFSSKNNSSTSAKNGDKKSPTTDWQLMVDESHVTLPQLRAMYFGDQARKKKLVKHGYRLPSALDNRPLMEDEFWQRVPQTLLISATPSAVDLKLSERPPVEMVLRPTHVCDPEIELRSPKGQLEDLKSEILDRIPRNERVLAITLTKRDAEDLASYLNEQERIRSTFLHSGLTTNQRSDALRALQLGEVDCLVGVNCLREGLDLPQVSLVAVLNADAEGFLRSRTALLQIVGRAARNVQGKAIFYANKITDSMRGCMKDTARRREKQLAYNAKNGCEVKSTKGSSMLSIFDLLKDKIEAQVPLQVVGKKRETQRKDSDYDIDKLVPIPSVSLAINGATPQLEIVTDHIPSSPGVYFWKNKNDEILYIGKANKLRSRVKSYLTTNAKHSTRIKVMLEKAASVDVVLTPSNRDALVLESNLIKHHQPPFNVLLKDDEHYPYICASVGDALPRFSCVPRPHDDVVSNQRYRHFGPYASFKEINEVLQCIEERYDLRAQSFLARHGSGSHEEYNKLFDLALEEVFDKPNVASDQPLQQMRSEYEEAGVLFDSRYNRCRDVVAIAPIEGQDSTAIVHVVQLRNGLVAGRFSYECKIPFGLMNEEDCSIAIQTVLEKQHYPSGQEMPDKRFSWFPDQVLLSHAPVDANGLRGAIRQARAAIESSRKTTVTITLPATRNGAKKEADDRAMEFATANANQVARERSLEHQTKGSAPSSVDGAGAKELASLLSLDRPPSLIECYDISHTQGDFPVGSRVVFENGQPAKHLYRKFNVRSSDGVNGIGSSSSSSSSRGNDDYASLAQVFERRFRRAATSSKTDDDWALPDLVVVDGGPGQLAAAIKGMSKAGTTVPICALAKNQEQVFVYGESNPVNDSPDSSGLLLLRALRDESHRFALNAHRQRRSVLKDAA